MPADQTLGQVDTASFIFLVMILYGSDKLNKNVILIGTACLFLIFRGAFRTFRQYSAIILRNLLHLAKFFSKTYYLIRFWYQIVGANTH